MIARYMIITYYRKANGMWDEITEFKNSIRQNHTQTAKVILDFKNKKIVKNLIKPNFTFDELLEFYKEQIGDRLTPYLPRD